MVLPGIFASKSFVFKPLKNIKYVDFPKKQSSLLVSVRTSTSQSSQIWLCSPCHGTANQAGLCEATQLSDLKYKTFAVNNILLMLEMGMMPLPFLKMENQYTHDLEVSRALCQI